MFSSKNDKEKLFSAVYELILSTSTELPIDVARSIDKSVDSEEEKSRAKYAIDVINENRILAKNNLSPLCQDTGTITFYVSHPVNFESSIFIDTAKQAVIKATTNGILRQNSVDSLTGKNTGNNLGAGHPAFYFEKNNNRNFEIILTLKGGGCENVGAQYALPYTSLNAGRDLDGVKKVILDCVNKAAGKGCSPGILGICIGGDRSSGYVHSKKQFLRSLEDKNTNESLAKLENEIVKDANQLGIGPMGFGGKTTLVGAKIGHLNRLPASYFVSISYMCWAFRRQGIVIDENLKIKNWIYK